MDLPFNVIRDLSGYGHMKEENCKSILLFNKTCKSKKTSVNSKPMQIHACAMMYSIFLWFSMSSFYGVFIVGWEHCQRNAGVITKRGYRQFTVLYSIRGVFLQETQLQ